MKRRNTAHSLVMPCTIWRTFHCFAFSYIVWRFLIFISFCFASDPLLSLFMCSQLISNCKPLLHFVDVGTKYMTHLLHWRKEKEKETKREKKWNSQMVKNSSRLYKCKLTLNDETTSIRYQIAIDVYGATISSAHPFMVKTRSFATTKNQHDIT